MRALKLSTIAVIAILAIVIPLGLITFADDPPPTTQITASYGSTWTITNFNEAQQAYTDSETRINTQRTDGIRLKNQADVIDMGYNGDKKGLEDLILNIGATIALGKSPKVGITAVFVKNVLDKLNDGKNFDLFLDLLSKWGEIEANNQEIVDAVSDRDKFYDLYKQWWVWKEGPNNPVPPKINEGSVSSMQESVPALGVRCGGACNAWWYNDSYWYQEVVYAGKDPFTPITDPITWVVGTRASTSELSALASSHKTSCAGCGDGYWSCKDSQVREHQQLYCGKNITWYTYDSLSGQWGTFALGVCGATYRRCDDPKKTAVHHYRPVMLSGQDSWGNSGYYISSYRADPPTAHGSGTTSASASINGPNGSGIPPGRMDDSPNCDSCMDGSRFCPEASTNHQGGQANNNGGGFGNTLNAACLDDDCTETITSSNASEHELVTCEACGVQYHMCNENDVYAHALVSCLRADCPRKSGTGGSNLYQKRRCQPNLPNTPFSCIDGRAHDFGGEAPANAPPTTVPDRPGSFALTPHRYAIRLTWTSSASNGGSAITAYEYQYQSSRNSRRTWSSWSSWTSAGTGNSGWINGLSSGVDYGIRMRAVNAVGNSTVTGIKIVRTTE